MWRHRSLATGKSSLGSRLFPFMSTGGHIRSIRRLQGSTPNTSAKQCKVTARFYSVRLPSRCAGWPCSGWIDKSASAKELCCNMCIWDLGSRSVMEHGHGSFMPLQGERSERHVAKSTNDHRQLVTVAMFRQLCLLSEKDPFFFFSSGESDRMGWTDVGRVDR